MPAVYCIHVPDVVAHQGETNVYLQASTRNSDCSIYGGVKLTAYLMRGDTEVWHGSMAEYRNFQGLYYALADISSVNPEEVLGIVVDDGAGNQGVGALSVLDVNKLHTDLQSVKAKTDLLTFSSSDIQARIDDAGVLNDRLLQNEGIIAPRNRHIRLGKSEKIVFVSPGTGTPSIRILDLDGNEVVSATDMTQIGTTNYYQYDYTWDTSGLFVVEVTEGDYKDAIIIRVESHAWLFGGTS